MPLTSVIAKTTTLTAADREQMFSLHCSGFSNVRRDVFYGDLEQKDWVILLRDADKIVGFSTLQILRLEVGDRPRVFLFSGDTLVERAHWQDSKLAGCFGHFMLRLIAQHPDAPLYWFLISKGYRTYRFLPVYFHRFYPAHDRETPPEYAALLRTVAAHKFNGAYDPESGLIRAGERGDRLNPTMCAIPAGRADDPHVRFFLAMNPRFSEGDELACIADISKDNLNQYAWRVIERATVVWHE